MSAIRQVKRALDLKLVIEDEVVVEVCSEVMAERSEYFKGLVAHDMAEQNNGTVDLTAMCRERSLLPADIEWVVGSVEKGQALPLPDQEEDEGEAPVLIRLLRAAAYFGECWDVQLTAYFTLGPGYGACFLPVTACWWRRSQVCLGRRWLVVRCWLPQVARGGAGGGGADGRGRDGRAARGQGLQ
jgi:hypothetical protein